MAALEYHVSLSGRPGYTIPVTLSNGEVRRPIIPAVILASAADGSSMPAGTAADPSFTQTAPLPAATDRSGTAATSSGQLAAANASRRGLNIQNIGANNLGVNEFGGAAAIGTAGTYTITPGGSLNVRSNRQINVIAATGATAYTATEW